MFAAKGELFTVPSGYQISRSVRLRSSATAYFNRTPSVAGDQTKFTISLWFKRGALTAYGALFDAYSGAGANYGILQLQNDDTLLWFNQTASVITAKIQTNALYRDPSAWYHVVAVYDSTQATAANRLAMYVNGSQLTSFSIATYPTLNQTNTINGTVPHDIGRFGGAANYFDGYLTEVNFVDGQALTPSSFGEYDSITGVWKPKKYTGTYGTNGFYLNFSDNSAATAATIGKDYSGNGNNWTPNNISVTAGVTYDSMLDVPTSFPDGGNGRGNYCVASPVNYRTSTPTPTITDGNLKWIGSSATVSSIGCASIGASSGKWYWEVTRVGTNTGFVGVVNGQFSATTSSSFDLGYNSNEYAYISSGNKVNNNSSVAYGASYTSGDVIGVALDLSAGTLTFYKNNTSQGTAYSGLTLGNFWTPAFDSFNSAGFTLNFGQRPFSYTPPSGFLALNTQNLPDATIKNGASYMAATLYTGNATVRSISNGGNNTIGTTFQPDFVWIKSRTPTAWSHELFDALRGALNYLSSNLTAANQVEATSLTAFNSNGFSTGVWAPINGSGESLVAWQWNAGGSTVTNTSGSISAQVRANPTAGFSIVTYTGTGATATVGHGLGVAPNMILTKRTSGAVANWAVYHSAIGNGVALSLNQTTAQATNSAFWQNTTPTSTVFSVGSSGDSNPSGATVVAYCFSAVAGYSAFGKYTGNASTDGPFVFLGFRPRWLMIKNSSLAGDDWILFDSSRDTYNVTNLNLRANTSGAESTQSANYLDFLSNGFKIRGTSAGTINASQTYIYMAFAENPFKYSLAR